VTDNGQLNISKNYVIL